MTSNKKWSIGGRKTYKNAKKIDNYKSYPQTIEDKRNHESLLTKLAKLEFENSKLKKKTLIENKQMKTKIMELRSSVKAMTSLNTILKKQLLVEEKTKEEIQKKEVKVLNKTSEFLTIFAKFVNQMGYEVALFGGFIRRVMEPRSHTISEHERFMSGLKDSDLDICIFNNDIDAIPPHLSYLMTEMEKMGIITNISVDKYNYHDDEIPTEFMKFSLVFKGTTFKIDMFNRRPSSKFFGTPDYDSNLFQINSYDNAISIRTLSEPFDIIQKILSVGIKKASPVFPTMDIAYPSSISVRQISKMLVRQEKLIKNGYTINTTIVHSKFNTSGERCCVCMNSKAEKDENNQRGDEHFIAPCLCKEGRNLCLDCTLELIHRGEGKCPNCRQQFQIRFNTDKEIEEKNEEESSFPLMTIIERFQQTQLPITPPAMVERVGDDMIERVDVGVEDNASLFSLNRWATQHDGIYDYEDL